MATVQTFSSRRDKKENQKSIEQVSKCATMLFCRVWHLLKVSAPPSNLSNNAVS
jgi:hypothetical protein